MKKLISLSVIVLFFISFTALAVENKPAKNAKKTVVAPAKVEVFYFHYTRRCVTCNAVENVTKEAISEIYPVQSKKRQITFRSVNLDEETSAAFAKRCNAEGQALLVISGSKRIDITDKAFMYAKSSPAKLKAELKKSIDALL